MVSIFFRILAQTRPTETARREAIARLRYIYKENMTMSFEIYLFEQYYSSHAAFFLFTQPSFFYRAINVHRIAHKMIYNYAL